jgi:hypothetical protein
VAKAGADNQSAYRAVLSGLIDETNDRGCRRSNDHEFRHERQFAETVDRHNAVDR